MDGDDKQKAGGAGGGSGAPDKAATDKDAGAGSGSAAPVIGAPLKAGGVANTGVSTVVVHPLVLLSVTDHYYRVAKDARNKRVVGVILGESFQGRVDVTNSFAVPFEEDPREPGVFFLDHDYLDTMAIMFKKIAAKERILGFYSTGPRIRPADVNIDALFRARGYCAHPLLVIVDVRPDQEGLPVQAYVTQEEVTEGGRDIARTYAHVPSEVGAYEAEEVGVEHLLRDINDPSVSHLAGDIRGKLAGLKGLASRLQEVGTYLTAVLAGKLPQNNEVLYQLQTALALLPNLGVDPMPASMFEVTNDEHLSMYIAALGRSVLALHDLLQNKLHYRDSETAAGAEDADKKEGKDGEAKKDGKEGDDKKKEGGKDAAAKKS